MAQTNHPPWQFRRAQTVPSHLLGTRPLTSNAQAFFAIGVATPIYNVALSFYFMFIVRFQWPERKCAEHEKWFHGSK